jgi:hypothetical protein
MAEDAVSCELFSAFDSLPTGKNTGISRFRSHHSTDKRQPDRRLAKRTQYLWPIGTGTDQGNNRHGSSLLGGLAELIAAFVPSAASVTLYGKDRKVLRSALPSPPSSRRRGGSDFYGPSYQTVRFAECGSEPGKSHIPISVASSTGRCNTL